MEQNNFEIPIFYGTYADLTKIDLSFINFNIVNFNGIKFRQFVRSIVSPEILIHSYNFIFRDSNQDNTYVGKRIKKYAIIPADNSKPFIVEDWQHFHQLMLSVYPSDFSLVQTIQFDPIGQYYQCSGKSDIAFKPSGNGYFDNFMFITKAEYSFVKKYLANYFHSSLKLKYLKYLLSVYSNSFLENNPIFQYISLIICLEVIVEGKEQLTYKLRRNTALLCGNNIENCKRIFKNVEQLYKLRSAIVHGEIKPSYKHFKDYHSYLKMLVARLIRELVVHNIQTIEELNEKITSLGYGQNKQISKDYIYYKYPIVDNIHLSYKAIQKY